MDYQQLLQRAKDIKQRYASVEQRTGGRTWDTADRIDGLVGDVGDLMKLLMAKRGLRSVPPDLDEKIAHELSDCLWCIMLLADDLGVDLEAAFMSSMDELEKRIQERAGSN